MGVKAMSRDGGFSFSLGGVACECRGLFVNHGGLHLSIADGAIRFDKLERRPDGEDSFGSWAEEVAGVVQPANVIPPMRLVLRTARPRTARPRRYDAANLAVLHLENDIQDAMFDADAVAGVQFDVPAAGPGYVTHLKMHEFSTYPAGHFFSTSTFCETTPGGLELDWGNFAICEAGAGRYFALLPLAGSGMGARITAGRGRLGFVSAGLDGTKLYNRIPLGIAAVGRDPYRLVHDLFRAAKEATGHAFSLREEKELPAIFSYLGWCSWNAFGQAVKADDVLNMAAKMRQHGVPAGYFLIDDGWQSVKDGKLTGFDADPEKFPGGLAQLVSRLKQDFGIRHVGVWHTLQGYWNGIDPASPQFAGNPQWFWFGRNRRHCPNPLDEHGRRFMAEWYRRLRGQGIDFVKVDNQGGFRGYFYNMLPQDEAMGKMQANLQNAAGDHGLPIINCMEMHPECYFHYFRSSIGRVNADFIPEGESPTPENLALAKRHLQDSLYNSLWFQEIIYPDYDMFQTHHAAATCFAALNAISGGPLYTTDVPERSNLELLGKLMNDDGTLLRPVQPARPCAECLTIEPMTGKVPLAAFAPVKDGAVVVAMNIGPAEHGLKASLGLKGLQLPPSPRYAVYSHFGGKIATATARQAIELSLGPMEVEVFSVVPIRNRFAAVGLVDRFVSPAGVASIEQRRDAIDVELTSGGLFGAYTGMTVKGVRCGDADGDVRADGDARQELAAAKGAPGPEQYSLRRNLLLVNTSSRRITILF